VDDTLTTCELTGPTGTIPLPVDSGSCPGNAKTYTGLANGSYTLKIVAKDKTANSTGNTYIRSFTIAGP
jgi:hypothetical protein